MIGKTIGNHKIIEQIGEGGMGIVYKAKQLSLSRMVAIKILPRRLTRESSFVRRFFNEAKAIASLNHPNIVQIYDVGKEGENYYYTMELIDGVSLEEIVIKRLPVSLDRAVRIISSVAKALDYTHKRGIVHRDIKPSNIMIDKSGRVKLTDFGLALQDKATRLTTEGGLIGTPEFMSPEQIYGQTATALSDIYSLGVVFYELMTGSSPFEAETALAVIERIKTEDPEPPRSINPEISPEIEEIIMKMIDKNPADRYQDCREIRLDLKLYRTGETTTPPSRKTALRLGPSMKMVAVGLLAALAIGLGLFHLRSDKGPPEAPKVEKIVEAVMDAETAAAKETMEQAMTEAAAELAPMLIASAGFPGVRFIDAEGQGMRLSGEIKAKTEPEASQTLSALRLNLENYCGEVGVNEGAFAAGVLPFHIDLRCASDLRELLRTDILMDTYPLCGRVWQIAEAKRHAADSFLREHNYVSAGMSYRSAAELYAKTMQTAGLAKEMSALEKKLPAATREAKASGFPDIIVLNNGKKMECKVISESADSVRIRTSIGTAQFPQAKIEAIIRATPAETKKVSALQSEIDEIQKKISDLKARIDKLHLSAIRNSLGDTPYATD